MPICYIPSQSAISDRTVCENGKRFALADTKPLKTQILELIDMWLDQSRISAHRRQPDVYKDCTAIYIFALGNKGMTTSTSLFPDQIVLFLEILDLRVMQMRFARNIQFYKISTILDLCA